MSISLRLQQYRNYTDTTFTLGQHTIFIGPNGSGKTNVVEAIRTLSVTKSFRITQDRDAILWDESYCRLTFHSEGLQLEYIVTREEFGTKKVMKHNGVIIPLTQVYGLLPTVLFSPESMQLVDGSPEGRRRFLDTILSQSDPEYLHMLMLYRKVLKERHFVLLRLQQGLGHSDELDFWDNELVRSGSYIIEKRNECVRDLNKNISTIYPHFTDNDDTESLSLLYKPVVEAEQFKQKLLRTRSYDTKTGNTSVGPHRDDMIFLLRDRNITLFASRGETRRCILSLKLAEAQYFTDLGRDPYVLLDDVFSELDEIRRDRFLNALAQYKTVITTTDTSFINEAKLTDAKIYHLPLEAGDGIAQ